MRPIKACFRRWVPKCTNSAVLLVCMSPKRGFLFPEKRFSCFQGVQWRGGMSPKRGFLFSENKVGRFQGVQWRGGMSPKRGFLFSENKVGACNILIAVRPIVAFIVIKLCPCIVVCSVRCFLPSGDGVCRGECDLPAKREYH